MKRADLVIGTGYNVSFVAPTRFDRCVFVGADPKAPSRRALVRRCTDGKEFSVDIRRIHYATMQFFKSESGEFLAVETCPHMGLVVRRRESYDVAPLWASSRPPWDHILVRQRESYDVAPGLWGAPEVTFVDGVLREEDEFGVSVTPVASATAEEVIATWGFDPRMAIWSQRHHQWIFPGDRGITSRIA